MTYHGGSAMRWTRALSLSAVVFFAGRAQAQEPAAIDPAAFVRRHCAECHGGGEDLEADLDLVGWIERVGAGREWSAIDVERAARVSERLAAGDMPPDGARQPSAADRAAFAGWLQGGRAAPAVTIRRLSRVEYRNCVRDVLGVDSDRIDAVPPADLGHGFDNIGAATAFSPLHLEAYLAVAEAVAQRAISVEDPAAPPHLHFEAEAMECSLGEDAVLGDWLSLFSNGTARVEIELPRAGRYRVRLRARGQQAGPDPVQASVWAQAARVAQLVIEDEAPAEHDLEVELDGGRQTLAVSFDNDYYRPQAVDPAQRDRNLILDWLELIGPLDPPRLSSGHRWLSALAGDRGSNAERLAPAVEQLLLRCWRRPPSATELVRVVERAAAVADDEGRLVFGLRHAVVLALASPHFLFRPEPAFDGHALAARLSFFLWSSGPDAALLAAAADGSLRRRAVLSAQAARLLEDPRASALAENFAVQWLELRALQNEPEVAEERGGSDQGLRAAMRRESVLLFETVLRERRPATELLTADYTFVNEALAQHYRLPGVRGAHFRRVPLTDARRRGLLAHAGILTLTSNPDRTSPVKRGKWILSNLLARPPAPPPPGADSFDEAAVDGPATMRAMLEAHRRDARCAACHARMDGLGLALEHFDRLGRWRDSAAGQPIDAGALLPGGTRVDGVAGVVDALVQDAAVVRGLLIKLFTFGVGRPPTALERAGLEHAAAALPADAPIAALIDLVVTHAAFREAPDEPEEAR